MAIEMVPVDSAGIKAEDATVMDSKRKADLKEELRLMRAIYDLVTRHEDVDAAWRILNRLTAEMKGADEAGRVLARAPLALVDRRADDLRGRGDGGGGG